MTVVLYAVGAVAGVLLVLAVFQLRTESPDNQRRVVIGGAPPKPTKSFRSLFKQPEPDPCEDSTLVKVQWLANKLVQD
jgi:hypothetical protein